MLALAAHALRMTEVFRSSSRPGRTFHRAPGCIRAASPSPLADELAALTVAARELAAHQEISEELPWPCTSCALSDTLAELHASSSATLRVLIVPWPVTESTEEWQVEPARLIARDAALEVLLAATPALLRTPTVSGAAVVCELGADALALCGMTWRTVVLGADLPAPTPEALEVFAALDVADLDDLGDSPLERHLADRDRFLAASAAVTHSQ